MGESQGSSLNVWFCRHGETHINAKNCVQGERINPPLNEKGRTQAKFLGEHMKKQNVDFLVASISERAVETAGQVKKHFSEIPYSEYKELVELRFGDLEGTHLSQGYSECIRLWDYEHQIDLRAPGEEGESPFSCLVRSLPTVKAIIAEGFSKGYKDIVIVIHSRLIQILLSYILDRNLDNMLKYKQGKAAINIIEVIKTEVAETLSEGEEGDGKAGKTGHGFDVDGELETIDFFSGGKITCVPKLINFLEHIPEDFISSAYDPTVQCDTIVTRT